MIDINSRVSVDGYEADGFINLTAPRILRLNRPYARFIIVKTENGESVPFKATIERVNTSRQKGELLIVLSCIVEPEALSSNKITQISLSPDQKEEFATAQVSSEVNPLKEFSISASISLKQNLDMVSFIDDESNILVSTLLGIDSFSLTEDTQFRWTNSRVDRGLGFSLSNIPPSNIVPFTVTQSDALISFSFRPPAAANDTIMLIKGSPALRISLLSLLERNLSITDGSTAATEERAIVFNSEIFPVSVSLAEGGGQAITELYSVRQHGELFAMPASSPLLSDFSINVRIVSDPSNSLIGIVGDRETRFLMMKNTRVATIARLNTQAVSVHIPSSNTVVLLGPTSMQIYSASENGIQLQQTVSFQRVGTIRGAVSSFADQLLILRELEDREEFEKLNFSFTDGLTLRETGELLGGDIFFRARSFVAIITPNERFIMYDGNREIMEFGTRIQNYMSSVAGGVTVGAVGDNLIQFHTRAGTPRFTALYSIFSGAVTPTGSLIQYRNGLRDMCIATLPSGARELHWYSFLEQRMNTVSADSLSNPVALVEIGPFVLTQADDGTIRDFVHSVGRAVTISPHFVSNRQYRVSLTGTDLRTRAARTHTLSIE